MVNDLADDVYIPSTIIMLKVAEPVVLGVQVKLPELLTLTLVAPVPEVFETVYVGLMALVVEAIHDVTVIGDAEGCDD